MKVLSTDGLTKLIQLIKNSFISVDDTVTTGTTTLAAVATSGSYNDLSDKPISGSGLEVCDIGMALYVDETQGLRRYLNGQIIERNANTEAFFTKLQEITTLYPSLLCTEEEWQTAKTMSAFGQVGKFVFNYETVNNNINTYDDYAIMPLAADPGAHLKITPVEALDTLQIEPSEQCGTPQLSSDKTYIKVDIYGAGPFTISAAGYKTYKTATITSYDYETSVKLEKDETSGGTENTGEQVIVSVRLPRVVNVQGLFDLQNLGMTVRAGLPNIVGNFKIWSDQGFGAGTGDGAFSASGSTFAGSPSRYNNGTGRAMTFDASRSNPIYGNSDTVQPEAIQYPYFIQIATGQETENNIINDIELNNPYSLFDSKYSDHELNNLSWLKSEGQWNAKAVYTDAYDKLLKVYNGTETVEGLSVKLSTETYTDYDFVLNTAEETFRLPLKTKQKFYDNTAPVVGNGMTLGLTNGTSNFGLWTSTATQFYPNSRVYGQPAGTSSNTQADGKITTGYGVTTDPTKSGIETHLTETRLYLYYYVGETVQNANLIDAGRIGEQLANKQDKCIHIIDTYVNGTSWYRVWSDGWCEQGFCPASASASTYTTATLLKPFKDTNYSIFISFYNGNWSPRFNSKTTSSFTFDTNVKACWIACGYIN